MTVTARSMNMALQNIDTAWGLINVTKDLQEGLDKEALGLSFHYLKIRGMSWLMPTKI